MVLGEFTKEEKEIVFSDLKLRQYLINEIIDKVEDLNELPEFKSEEVVINLALEYLLESLENPEKEELFAIAAQSADNAHIMAGTNILLERYDEVDFWLKRIPEDERKEFVKFPIFNLKKESGQ